MFIKSWLEKKLADTELMKLSRSPTTRQQSLTLIFTTYILLSAGVGKTACAVMMVKYLKLTSHT